MAIMNMHLPARLNPGVIPVEAPVVPRAETVSNKRCKNGMSGSVMVNTATAMAMNPRPKTATAKARYNCGWGISRPNASAWARCRNEETTAATMMAKVTTLIPPATEPAAPPMNIRPE